MNYRKMSKFQKTSSVRLAMAEAHSQKNDRGCFEKMTSEDRMYWLEGKNDGNGGIFWRGFDLVEFIKKIESDARGFGKVVAIRFEKDSYNVEFVTENKPKEVA